MKTTDRLYPVLDFSIPRDDREALLEARQQIDEVLRDLVPNNAIIGTCQQLEAFFRSRGHKQLRGKHARHMLYAAAETFWNKQNPNLDRTKYNYANFRKAAGRKSNDGFFVEELDGATCYREWNRLSTPDSPVYQAFLWDYLAQYGIFKPD